VAIRCDFETTLLKITGNLPRDVNNVELFELFPVFQQLAFHLLHSFVPACRNATPGKGRFPP